MAESTFNKAVSKKGEPKDGPPKSKLGLIGGILLLLGVVWFAWSAWLRPLTPKEIKAEQERLQQEKQDADREKRKQEQKKR